MDGLIVPCEMQLANGAAFQDRSEETWEEGRGSGAGCEMGLQLEVRSVGFYKD